MSFLAPKELKQALALTQEDRDFVSYSRERARQILSGKLNQKVILVGPCSIHNTESAYQYAIELKKLLDQVDSHCFIIMRTYLEKSRTCNDWKGFIHDPLLDESHDLENGIFAARKLLLSLTKLKVPVAMEFVSPLISSYLSDLISWGFIGARTATSQIHRQLASSFPFPVGFKNSVDGNIDAAINSVITARQAQVFLHANDDGKICKITSRGNPLSHVVLRGSEKRPNYDLESISLTLEKLQMNELPLRIMIDCSHGNSQKNPETQKDVFSDFVKNASNRSIFGLMLESHLKGGSQSFSDRSSDIASDISLTDPCLSLSSTKELIHELYESLSSSMISSVSLT